MCGRHTNKITNFFQGTGIFFVTFGQFLRLIYVDKAKNPTAVSRIKGMGLKTKGRNMKSRDTDIIGLRARRETEEFINQNIHDRAKGWPVSYHFGTDYTDSRQVKRVSKQGKQTQKRSA